MILKELKPRKALNKAYLKVKPTRSEIEGFKTNLKNLLDRMNDGESEEFHKNLVIDFLKKTYYDPNHFINTKGRNDLVIHTGQTASSTVGVIIEAKKPTNKVEMISSKKVNVKAFHELVLYYLRERITHKNLEIKHLIATNINEWFIFDEHIFERIFVQNKSFVRQFENFEASKKNTDVFYKDIAEPFIDGIMFEIEFTYFNIQDFQKALRNTDRDDDKSLIALFKLLSPEHLLKLPFSNDSNSLDKRFYIELLHIIGLTETKNGGKKLIDRNAANEQHSGTILENTILQLDSLDKLSRLEKPYKFGITQQERLFNVALELTITWINRILFLKLLEAQLITYHKGDKSYSFLNIEKIQNYDDLNSLFFQVLARRHDERNEDVKMIFKKTPYLNSSLFEPTDIEQLTLFISNLKDDKQIPIFSQTVLKDQHGKRSKGNISTLQYLFSFLDAYDFGAEGAEEIQEGNKTLINASVLGLIFEKINGYKDGSFFTPGFITMYMCREGIRRAVLQKFNDTKHWNCKTIEELYDKIENRTEANEIVNSIKICDPAVGSGHFLVSALNEMIAVKNDLKILQDRSGRRLKEYQIDISNDELIVTNEDGQLFEYNPKGSESQRVQEALFHEKQLIIENCLFGVDINPNSVKICRLRLWIELLKNSYYKNDSELETLPNIDINIKSGNSLMSQVAMKEDLRAILKKKKMSIEEYRNAVYSYKNAKTKEEKWQMENFISKFKSDLVIEINKNGKEIKDLIDLEKKYFFKYDTTQLFEHKLSKSQQKDKEKLQASIEKQKKLIDKIRNNKIYENAFEWRFEFPEVLNDDGDFIGFDLVIGNPPYGLFNKKQNKKIALTTDELTIKILKKKYPEAHGGVVNAARIFLAFSYTISAKNGLQSMIIPYGILTDTTSVNLRKHIFNNHSLISVDAFPERDNTNRRVFEDVKMSTTILLTSKKKVNIDFDLGISYEKSIPKNRSVFNPNELIKLSPDLLQIPLTDSDSFNLLVKIFSKEDIIKLGNLSVCNTGEVDMTFGKSALTLDDNDNILLKGVQLDRYVTKLERSQISQGEIEYINLNKLETKISQKKLNDSHSKRIALQGLTGVNEKRRLKANIIDENIFLANSCNYLLKPDNCDLELILAWLNSKLLNFVFKCRSTSSNVNGYEIDNLPFCFNKHDDYLIKLSNQILNKKAINIYASTIAEEASIDDVIYKIFDLSSKEIEIIESMLS